MKKQAARSTRKLRAYDEWTAEQAKEESERDCLTDD
jgi:hypothetical protein